MSHALRGAVWTGNRWIVVGDAGTILSSADGRVWRAASGIPNVGLRAVAARPGLVIAAGSGGSPCCRLRAQLVQLSCRAARGAAAERTQSGSNGNSYLKVEQRTREVSSANEELRKEITERRRAEAARRHSEEQFRNVVDTATDAVVSIDETGHILYLNPAITRIFGYSAAELIGQSLTILMPRGLRDLHHAGFERYLRTGQRHLNWQGVELTAVRKGGEEFPVEISFGEVASNSQHVFTGFIRDITERKEAEELRQARARQSAIRADISHALTGEEDLRVVLQRCAEAMVQHLDVAFARIWTRIDDARLLEMQASAGMYTHIDGPA